MKTIVRCLAVLIFAALCLAVSQRRQIQEARAELANPKESAPAPADSPARASAASVATQSVPPPSLDQAAAAEIDRLRAENRDIYKLRGEIAQAREKQKEFTRLQADNVQLRQKIADLRANPPAAGARPLPFANKGQSTPEAALETAFWSMYRGDLEGLSRAMPMATDEYDKMAPGEKTNALTMLRAMAASIGSLEVLDRKQESLDLAFVTVHLAPREGLGLLPNANVDRSIFILRRTNDLWQVIGQR